MEGGWGTAAAPIIFARKPGSTGVVDLTSIDVKNCTYMYFADVQFKQARTAAACKSRRCLLQSRMQRAMRVCRAGAAGPPF